MREIVDVGGSSLLTISTGSDASQQSEIISPGNRAVHRHRVKCRTRSKERRNSWRSRTLSLRDLVSKYECERVFPAGVGPGSPSRDAADWIPSRVSQSVETRRRYGWLRMVFPGARLFRALIWCPSEGMAARERQGALSWSAW